MPPRPRLYLTIYLMETQSWMLGFTLGLISHVSFLKYKYLSTSRVLRFCQPCQTTGTWDSPEEGYKGWESEDHLRHLVKSYATLSLEAPRTMSQYFYQENPIFKLVWHQVLIYKRLLITAGPACVE